MDDEPDEPPRLSGREAVMIALTMLVLVLLATVLASRQLPAGVVPETVGQIFPLPV